MTAARVGPGRHRSAAADAAILGATLQILRERGYEALTVAGVIERAGVSSATLYRRWPTKHELVAAAIASLAPEAVTIDTGRLQGDITGFVRHVARTIAARGNVIDVLLGGKRDPDLAQAMREKLLTPRVRALEDILQRAVERGELAAAPVAATCLTLIVGPIHYRAVVLGEPLTPSFLRHVVHHALHGLLGDATA
jgi:AcrR family transcriptional regulator